VGGREGGGRVRPLGCRRFAQSRRRLEYELDSADASSHQRLLVHVICSSLRTRAPVSVDLYAALNTAICSGVA